MCILLLYTGDETTPTVICNNRDEYYTRATNRGSLFTHSVSINEGEESEYYSYAPKDLQGGGSWLHFDHLCHPNKPLRYAVVLNFHHWREYSVFSYLTNHWQTDITKLASRGKLVSNFMNDNTISAKDYAEKIYHERMNYRPFNLIVSDSNDNTYYISSSLQQTSVRKLSSGHLYGFSNGYMEDSWDKVINGKIMIQNILNQSLPDVNIPYLKDWKLQRIQARHPLTSTNTTTERQEKEDKSDPPSNHSSPMSPMSEHRHEHDLQQIIEYEGKHYTHHHKMNKFIENCREVMLDDRPLPDITLGATSLPIMQLAGIFVTPTIIVKDEHLSFWARLSEGKYRLIPKINEEEKEGGVQIDSEEIDKTEIFGTRTVTIFVYYSFNKTPSITSHEEGEKKKITSIDNNGDNELPKGLFTIIETDYMINENDNYSLVESTNVFTNM
eukprot:gene5930-6375_t